MAGSLPFSFISPRGEDAGRLTTPRVAVPQGDALLSLGADRTGARWLVGIGDRVAATQTLTRTGNSLRARILLVGPGSMPVLTSPEPFSLIHGQTLEFSFSSRVVTTTIDSADYIDVGAATAAELGFAIARDAPDLTTRLERGGRLAIEPSRTGRAGGEVRVVDGTAAAALGLARLGWVATMSVDGTEYTRRIARPGDERDLVDLTLPLDSAADPVAYELAMELVDLDGGAVPSPPPLLEVEIPGVYFDDIAFETQTGAYVSDRSPESGEVDRHVDGAISVSVCSASAADPVDDASIVVSVRVGAGGSFEVAMSALTVIPEWAGTGSGVAQPRPDQVVVTLVPTTPLPGETVVTVMVSGETDGGATTTSTYSFTTEDVTPPTVATVLATSKTTVDVEFDEAVSDSALTASYTLAPVDIPAVTPIVLSVTRASPERVTLSLDREASIGRSYQITIAGVEDEAGNQSATETLQFSAWIPPAVPGRSFDLRRMLPEFNTIDRDVVGDLKNWLAILQEVVDLLLCDVDEWLRILDPETAPEAFLDAMLLDLGNPFTFLLSVGQKRRLILILIEIYRNKGTAVGIVNTVRFFVGIEVEVLSVNADETWILDESELDEDTYLGTGDIALLYSFRVVSPVMLTQQQRDQIVTIAEYMKPAHTHLIELVEPDPIVVPEHVELDLSELDTEWLLH